MNLKNNNLLCLLKQSSILDRLKKYHKQFVVLLKKKKKKKTESIKIHTFYKLNINKYSLKRAEAFISQHLKYYFQNQEVTFLLLIWGNYIIVLVELLIFKIKHLENNHQKRNYDLLCFFLLEKISGLLFLKKRQTKQHRNTPLETFCILACD